MVPKVRDIGTIVSVASVVGAAIKPAVAIKPQIKPQITKPIKKKKKIKKKLKKKKKQGPNSIGFISSNLMQKFWIVESTPGVYSKLVSTNH